MEPREDDSRTRDIVNCTKYFVHPNYNAQNKHYDIALIILPSTGPVWNSKLSEVKSISNYYFVLII